MYVAHGGAGIHADAGIVRPAPPISGRRPVARSDSWPPPVVPRVTGAGGTC